MKINILFFSCFFLFISENIHAYKENASKAMYTFSPVYQDQLQRKDSWFYSPSYAEFSSYCSDCWHIVKALFQDQKHTAAFTASSPWLVNAITKYIPESEPIRILEAGSGPGTITQKIIESMHSKSELDGIEFSTDLYNQLCAKVKQTNSIRLYNCKVENWNPQFSVDKRYDMIISTLPITQLPYSDFVSILDRFQRMLKPGGLFLYITLCGASTLTLWAKKFRNTCANVLNYFVTLDQKEQQWRENDLHEYTRTLQALEDWQNNYFVQKSSTLIPLNIPPTYAICLQRK